MTTNKINVSELDQKFGLLKNSSSRLKKTSAKERIAKLKKLRRAISETYALEIEEALYKDLRKNKTEVELNEVMPVITAINHAIRNLSRWMRDKRVPTPITLFGFSNRIKYEPKGTVLIIAPWNFPLNLSLIPLVSAVAAGNSIVLKPSEISSHTSEILKKIIGSVFDEQDVSVIEGGIPETTHLLSKPFNHIFFTGAPSIGKIVMSAAAKNLTSVSLELGGKSPTIIDETADIEEAASRIAWSKNMNTGQVCIAPDYLFVHESIRQDFITAYKTKVQEMFSEDPQSSDSYGRIINNRHFDRLDNYMKDAIGHGAKVEMGGQLDADDKYISPTIVSDMPEEALLWQEEIFGPILPLRTYKNLTEVISYINEREKPLALYIYSKSRKNIKTISNETSSGAVVINYSTTHYVNPHLPFGGVNNSGIGKGNGHFGFLAFSNSKAIQRQWFPINTLKFFYPPYTESKYKLLKFVSRWLA